MSCSNRRHHPSQASLNRKAFYRASARRAERWRTGRLDARDNDHDRDNDRADAGADAEPRNAAFKARLTWQLNPVNDRRKALLDLLTRHRPGQHEPVEHADPSSQRPGVKRGKRGTYRRRKKLPPGLTLTQTNLFQ